VGAPKRALRADAKAQAQQYAPQVDVERSGAAEQRCVPPAAGWHAELAGSGLAAAKPVWALAPEPGVAYCAPLAGATSQPYLDGAWFARREDAARSQCSGAALSVPQADAERCWGAQHCSLSMAAPRCSPVALY